MTKCDAVLLERMLLDKKIVQRCDEPVSYVITVRDRATMAYYLLYRCPSCKDNPLIQLGKVVAGCFVVEDVRDL